MGAWVFFDELVLSVIVLVAVGFCVISGISIGVKHKLKHTLWTWSHLGPWWYIGGLIVIGVTSIGFQRTGTATTACSINGAFMYIGVAIAAFSCHHLLVHHTLSCVCAQTWAPPAWAAWLFRHFVLLHHVITCVLPILLAAAMNAVDPAVFATATTCSFNTRAGAAFIGLVPLFFVALSMVLLVVLHMTRSTTAGWVSRSHAAMYAVLGSLLALQIGTIHALNSTPTSEWQVIHITAFIVQSCLVLVVSTIWTMAPVSRHQQRASIEGKRGGKRSQHTSAASVDHRTTAVGSRQASYLMANNGAPETNDDLPFEWDDAASTPSFNSKLSHHIDGYTPMSTPKPMPAVGPRPVAPPKKPVRRHRVKQQQQQQMGVQGPEYASSPLHAEEHSDGAVYYAMNELPRPPPAATAYAGAGTAAAQQQHAGGVALSPYVPIEMTRRDAAGVRPIHLPRPAQQKPLVITERMSPTTRKHQL
ncbi:hypothetical protein PTSG_05837 [Salpingoeca rosetta]|uniref:Uncharacterized protein n=1 Tax=Salpingoeca rosetta (strain ATCC 50818 / BSB-021) TaxID=946362 RepID=F2UCX8_SALR5|nr:uncharacterized protein PTSG_05837 [Salpingoeca rosetta]EGD74473.1 hypothetical protein PTSG_05837 [Salpingoeca rosetta]|eukprot:XP_004992730.1 hypothetical protein PTSG_05837 [Salpingoeca rosetta]